MIESLFKNRNSELLSQFIRYAIVGLIVNSVGYCVYLLLTWLGLNPVITMTCLYCTAIVINFFGSKNFAFNHQGSNRKAAVRYFVAHAGGYGLNLCLLLVFHEHFGFPHQLVQAVATVVVALYLFITFKFFVFQNRSQTKQ